MRRTRYHFPLPRRERAVGRVSGERGLPGLLLDVNRITFTKKIYVKDKVPLVSKESVILEDIPRLVSVREKKIEIVEEPISKIEKIEDSSPPLIIKVETEVREESKRVSVVMAFRGKDRLEGLKRVIESLRKQSEDVFIILVEQDKSPVYQSMLEPLVDQYQFLYSPRFFNKSWAFNCGAILAKDDLILLHDGDLIAPENYVRESIRILGSNDIALPWSRIFYLTQESSESYPEKPFRLTHTFSSSQVCGGSLLVRRSFYLDIGGMDERFEGWGGEDNAFYIKACKMGRVGRAHPVRGPNLVHFYHPEAPRGHDHYSVNTRVMWDYYNRSLKDIKLVVKSLEPIGSICKYSDRERETGIIKENRLVRERECVS